MVKLLKDEGYPAENVDGVVYVHKKLSRGDIKELNSIFRKSGCRESRGCELETDVGSKKAVTADAKAQMKAG